MFTGSAVRWYVEGMTEYYAVIESLQNPAEYGIELLNLKGAIATNKNNITLTIGDLLLEDVAQKRFSIISFDTDVLDNRKAFQRQVKAGRVVGSIPPPTRPILSLLTLRSKSL